MLILPEQIMLLLKVFAPEFSERVFEWAKALVVGAILAAHKRTVSAALRVMGLSDEAQFQNYHRVLSRAKWSSLEVSKLLLGLLVLAFVGLGMPVVVGADETLERRNGPRIVSKGLFRDAVRSSQKHVIHSYGLRWVSMMLLVQIPFK
jgi:hypothetical protein